MIRSFAFTALFLLSTRVAYADDLLDTARGMKALFEKGYSIPSVIAIEKSKLMSLPPKRCIMVIVDRRHNTECPDDPMADPNLDKGFAACFDLGSDNVSHTGAFESQCPPSISSYTY